MATFTRSDDLRGAEFVNIDLSGARFVEADLAELNRFPGRADRRGRRSGWSARSLGCA
jgi:uncharacterized protein YjbI with pentapeptide repeats